MMSGFVKHAGRFGLLGEHLAHSYSPIIHAELGNYEYNLYEKKPEELEAFVQNGSFDGLNVTIPYKKTVIPFCSVISETACAAGSVNTIKRLSDGSLYGDNTDCFGFLRLLQKTGIDPAAGKTIVLGSGGSSVTVQAVLNEMNAKKIIVVSRNGKINYENIFEHNDAVLLVNTTPVGMFPNNGKSLIKDMGIFRDCRAVIDLIYNPARTELLLQAQECGIPVFNGLYMLVAQAKKAAELFTNQTIPDEKIGLIIKKIEKITSNIILIGMPGCGKTSTGRNLAQKMKHKFIDIDALVAKTAGKPVSAIITEDGEDEFRRLETEALCETCKHNGLVIATGGGIVKRMENKSIIRQNGVTVFIDRDISDLPVTGRPLSERDGVTVLAAERLPLYKKWSDFTVKAKNIEKTADEILAKLV